MTKLIKSNKLTQLVNKPTRVTHTSSTLIDLVITNKPSAVLSCDVVPQEIADNYLTSITVDIKKTKRLPIVRTFRHLDEYAKDNFFNYLKTLNMFNLILNTDDINRQVDVFTSTFIKCLDACAPYVTNQLKHLFAPWMSDCLREAMNLRDDNKKKT